MSILALHGIGGWPESVLERIPQKTGSGYKYNSDLVPTRWVLTADLLPDDLDTGTGNLAGAIRVSTVAFTYAAPFVAEIGAARSQGSD